MYADLFGMIDRSDSFSEEERNYWKEIVPHMTTDQRKRFEGILLAEEASIRDLEAKYPAEVVSLAKNDLNAWERQWLEARNILNEIEDA